MFSTLSFWYCAEHTECLMRDLGRRATKDIHLQNWNAEIAKIKHEHIFSAHNRSVLPQDVLAFYSLTGSSSILEFRFAICASGLLVWSNVLNRLRINQSNDVDAVLEYVQSNRYIIISSWSVTLSHYVSFSRTHIHDTGTQVPVTHHRNINHLIYNCLNVSTKLKHYAFLRPHTYMYSCHPSLKLLNEKSDFVFSLLILFHSIFHCCVHQ